MIEIPICDLPISRRPVGDRPGKVAEPCLLCGRWILDPSKAEYFELTTDGCVIVHPRNTRSTFETVPNSQGGFPVGPECARILRREAKRKDGAKHEDRK